MDPIPVVIVEPEPEGCVGCLGMLVVVILFFGIGLPAIFAPPSSSPTNRQQATVTTQTALEETPIIEEEAEPTEIPTNEYLESDKDTESESYSTGKPNSTESVERPKPRGSEEVDQAQEFVQTCSWLNLEEPDKKVRLNADNAYSIANEYIGIHFSDHEVDSMALLDQSLHGPSGNNCYEFVATNYQGSEFIVMVPTTMSANEVLSFVHNP